MTKLTDTQLIVLSKAAQRDDGVAQIPRGLPKPAARKLGQALMAKKLMREIRSKPNMPVWWQDDDDRPLSLVIMKAGREAIGLEDEGPRTVDVRRREAASHRQPDAGTGISAAISKRLQVIGMLSASSGATIEELVAATSWLPHTARAVLTGLRKEGFSIERQRPDGATVSTYRIVKQASKAG